MSTKSMGLRNFSKMPDKEKAYLVKLLIVIGASVIAGLISGLTYEDSGGSLDSATSRRIGWLLFWLATFGGALLIKIKYDMTPMTTQQIIRHGIFIGLLTFMFLWTVIFNYIAF